MRLIFVYIVIFLINLSAFSQNNCLDITVSAIQDANCNSPNSYTGSASIIVNNGSGNYSFQWQDNNGNPLFPPQNSNTANNLPPNNYIVEVTDLTNNCSEIKEISIGYIGIINAQVTLTPFSINPISYNVWTYDTVKIYNYGCETRVRPEFTISHPNAYLTSNDFIIQYYDALLNQWILINTIDNNGNVKGFYGDSTGSILNQPVISQIVRVRYNSSAPTGLYSSENELWQVDNNGVQISKLDSLKFISLELFNACPSFVNTSNITNVSCNGFNDGSIDVQVSGGVQPYTFEWSNGLFSEDLTNISSGTYSVIIQDAGICILHDTIYVNEPNSAIPDNRYASNITSNSVDLVFTGSNQIDQYRFRYKEVGSTSWQVAGIGVIDQIAETDTLKPLFSLNSNTLYEWQIKVWGLNSCIDGWSNSEYFTTSCVDLSFSVNPISCNNASDGEITVFTNGSSQYSFLWSNGDSTSTISNLASSTYIVTVYDDINNCSEIDSLFLLNPSVLQTSLPSSIFTCGSDTIIDIGFFDSVLWSTGDTTSSILIDTTSLYTVQVSNNSGCFFIDSVFVTIINATPNLTNVKLCNGDSLTLYSEGNSGYTNFWWPLNIISDSILISPSQNQNIQLIVNQNNYSCYHSIFIEVVDVPILTFTSSDVSCFNGSDGSAQVNVNSGASPYLYLWENSSTVNFANNLSAGFFQLEVIDSNNCSVIDSVFINQPQEINIIENIIPPSCFSFSDGSVQVNINGGTFPYSYFWSNGDTLNIADSISEGSIFLQVIDLNNCSYLDTFELTEPSQLELFEDSSSHLDILCYGENTGQINLNAIGGVPNYSFSIDGFNFQSSSQFNTLIANNYWFFVKDSNNCIDSTFITLTQPAFPLSSVEIISSHQDVTCNGYNDGQFEVSGIGGIAPYQYILNQDTSLIPIWDSLYFGTYNILILDNNNCSFDTTIQITQPQQLNSSYISLNPSCYGLSDGVLIPQASGGTPNYTYYFNNINIDTIFGLNSGSYEIIVIDSNLCLDTITAFLNDPVELELFENTNNHQDISCFGFSDGEFQVTAIGGSPNYLYQINNGPLVSSQIFIGLSAGIYTVSVLDANNCLDTISVNITQPNQIILSENLNNHQDVTCFSGSDGGFEVLTSGGSPNYLYQLDNGPLVSSQIFTGLSAGVYSVSVLDANNCLDSIVVTISQPIQNLFLNELTSLHQDVLCFGDSTGSFTVQASGGNPQYIYSISQNNWQNAPTFNNLNAGSYLVTVSDSNSCEEQLSVNISQPNILSVNTNISLPNCYNSSDGMIILNPQGGTPSYNYYLDSIQVDSIVSGLSAGNFSLSIIDSNNCVYLDTIVLTQPSQILISIDSIQNVNCYNNNDGLISFNITGGSPGYLSGLNGIYNYNNTFFNNLSAGSYYFNVTDTSGCIDSLFFIISQPNSLVLSVDSINNLSCYNSDDGNAYLNISGGVFPYTYYVNGISQNNQNLTNLSSQFYFVSVIDSNNCVVSDSFNILQPDSINIQWDSNNASCYNTSDGELFINVINGGFPPFSYSINDSSYFSTSIFTNLSAGIDTFWVQDSLGCKQQNLFNILQPDSIAISVISNQPSCYGECDGFVEASVIGGNTYSIYWSNFETGLINDSLCEGLITLTVLDSLGCSNIYSYYLQEPSPVFPIISNNGGVLQTSSEFLNYQWYNSSGPIFGANTFNFTPSTNDIYWVEVNDSSGCLGASLEYNFILSEIEFLKNNFKIYPNPIENYLNIISNYKGQFSLIDNLGKIVFLASLDNENKYDLTYLKSGIYSLKIETQKGVHISKIIKL